MSSSVHRPTPAASSARQRRHWASENARNHLKLAAFGSDPMTFKGWRERAADIFAKQGEIAAKMKSAPGPGTTDLGYSTTPHPTKGVRPRARYKPMIERERRAYRNTIDSLRDSLMIEQHYLEGALGATVKNTLINVFKKLFAAGEHHGKLSCLRSMKADGLPVETIAKYTGLAVDEIEKL